MQKISHETFQALMVQASIRPKLRREVRFMQAVASLSDEDWSNTELLAIADRSGNKGVLLLDDGQNVYAAAYEVSRGLVSASGKAQPIICDFCRTWQTGTRSGSVTLTKPVRGSGSVTFLCCADLHCSRHVRNLTSAAKTSRSQLREDMTVDERVARLRGRISEISQVVGLVPVDVQAEAL